MELPNIEYIIKLSGNDESVKDKLISVLKYELPLEITAYYNSILLNDNNQTIFCVHKLKHKIGILGLDKGYYIAEEYENQLKENTNKMQNTFEKIIISIQNFVDFL
ncbi:MAG: Hpt domain-containing protein [Flavobacterium sp.]|nr:Hpt domain-containing protein [Flavobacterium sp.]